MRSIQRTLSAVTAMALLSSLGCTREASRPQTAIAFVSPGLSNPFFVDMANAAREEALLDSTLSLTVQSPEVFANLPQQVDIIETAIAQRVNAISLVAVDSKGIVPVLKKAQDANIKLVLIDNTVDSVVAAGAGLRMPAHIGSDNTLGGKLAGEFLTSAISDSGEVAILEGIPSEVANARKDGFLAAIAAKKNVRVVASQKANYSRADALNVTRALLVAHPRLKGIFAANDEMALGALKAIAETKTAEAPLVVGFDAIEEAVASIRSGGLLATVEQQPKEMGRAAVRAAAHAAKGLPFEQEIRVPVKLISRTTLLGGR